MMNYGELETRPSHFITRDLIKKLMPKYKRHDDLIIVQEPAWEEFKKSLPLPVAHEENSPFSIDEDELASLVCQVIQKPLCMRLAVETSVKSDEFRRPNVRLVLGDTGVVMRKENHITYRFDVTKCMFSFGNISEKLRMAALDCSDEIVVDLFTGIGYFSLPLIIHAKAKHLYACEWNPDAVEAFRKNLILNKVDPKQCTILEGDNRTNRPTDVAQRVLLGILPSSLEWMQTAFECIDKSTGGILHCHDLVDTKLSDNDKHSNGSLEIPDASNVQNTELSPDKTHPQVQNPTTSDTSSLNQSLTSSTSSHSTIEKLSVQSEDKTSSESDLNSPVFVEKPSGSVTNFSMSAPEVGQNNSSHDSSSNSLRFDDNVVESVQLTDRERSIYESRAQVLIDKIREDVEAHNLRAFLVHIQPVKSYGPHVNHIVFDIKIEPKDS